MSRIIILFVSLIISHSLVAQEEPVRFVSAAWEINFSSAKIVSETGEEGGADLRFAPWFNLQFYNNIDKESHGFFYGFTIRNIGFIYRNGEEGRFPVEVGDLVINSAQPKSRLASVLLEPQTIVEDSVTYDITAWALPYAYNLDAVATNGSVQSSDVAPPSPVQSIVEESYAYLLTWNGVADVRVLAELLSQDVRVRFATNPFRIDGNQYEAGTLIVAGADNNHLGSDLGGVVNTIAASHQQPVASIQSGFVDSGNDIGSNAVGYLNAPSIMIVAGNSISSYGLGELWNYFDNEIGYPTALVNGSDMGRIDLDDYDVIIFPSGSYSDLLNDDAVSSVSGWIRRGGKLIAIESAVQFLSGIEGFDIDRKANPGESDSTAASKLKIYGERVRSDQSDRVRGAIYRATIDRTHPLGFGYGTSYYALKRSTSTYDYSDSAWNVATISDGTAISGFAGNNTESRLENSLLWGHQSVGSGDVIYFTNNPIYRGFWHGGMLALANAVFLVGQ